MMKVYGWYGVFWVAALALFGACDTGLVGKGAETAAPTQIAFAVDGQNVYYATLAAGGERSPTVRLNQIPLVDRVAVIVLVAEETPEVEGHYYVADLLDARVGERVTADLRSVEEISLRLQVAEAGARDAVDIWARAANMARAIDDAILAEKRADRDAERIARQSKRPPRPVPESVSGIEIFRIASSLGLDIGAGMQSQLGGGTSDLAPQGWKPVTMYYAEWCGVCRQAKGWLDRNKVPYRLVDVDASEANSAAMNAFIQSNQGRTGAVPTFQIGDEMMQGWSSERFTKMARL